MIASFKTSLVAATVALGALAGSLAPAQAGGGIGFFLDSHGNAGVSIGLGHGHGHVGIGVHGGWHGCSQYEALDKAASLGVKKRWIKSVSHKNVVVRGKMAGHPVQVVMRRHSDHCSVKRFDYI